MEACREYCDILRYEFLFNKPCQKLEYLLNESFDRLQEQQLLSIPSVRSSEFRCCTIFLRIFQREWLIYNNIIIKLIWIIIFQELTADQIRTRRFYAQFDESSEDSYDGRAVDNMTITLPAEGHGKRVVLASVLAPYSYTYMAVVRSLESLRDYGLLEGEFIKVCVQEITSQVNNGNCKYGKCSSALGLTRMISPNSNFFSRKNPNFILIWFFFILI